MIYYIHLLYNRCPQTRKDLNPKLENLEIPCANREFKELTLNEQRNKLLRQLAKSKGIITRNKARYEAITPHKRSKNKDLKDTKEEYKKLYEKAETKRVEVSTQLKEAEKLIK